MIIKIRIVSAGFLACICLLFVSSVATASRPKEARVTRAEKDVTFVSPEGNSSRASLNQPLPNITTVRTGADSCAEITFPNQATARLWGNTVLGVNNGTRDLDLKSGVVLVQAPKGVKGKVHGAGVAAAISGATILFEDHEKVFKFLVLEGIGRLYRPGHLGDSVLVHPGQMIIGNPKFRLNDPVDFDIGRFVKTSRLFWISRRLSSRNLMIAESVKQQREKSKKF